MGSAAFERTISRCARRRPRPKPRAPFPSGPNADRRTGVQPLQQAHEMLAPQGDAAFGRAIFRPGQVHEHSAAGPAYARSRVVAEHHHKVVEAVVAPQPLGTGWVGMPDGAVVVAVGGSVAPAIVGRDRQHRQPRRRVPAAVGAVEHGRQAPAPDGRGPVAFALAHAAAAATQGAGKCKAPKPDDPACCSSRQSQDGGGLCASSARGGVQAAEHFARDSVWRLKTCFTRHRNARLLPPWKQYPYLEPKRYEHRTEDSHRRRRRGPS